MPECSEAEAAFLKRHGIELRGVYLAHGRSRRLIRSEMRQQGKLLSVGDTPCQAFGHTIRTRAGHCAQCNPARIRYAFRHYEKGLIYIARSVNSGLIKIGVTRRLVERQKDLNDQALAYQSDWLIIVSASHPQAGVIETAVHRELSSFNQPEPYMRRGGAQICKEIFNCPAETAVAALKKTLGSAAKIQRHHLAPSEYDRILLEGLVYFVT